MDMDRPTGSSTFFTEWLRRLRECARRRLPLLSSAPAFFAKGRLITTKRMIHAALAFILLMTAAVIAVRPEGRQLMMEEESYVPWIEGEMESQDELPMWGWSEAMGWKQHPDLGLAVLGEPAEEKFRLTVAAGQDGMIESVHLCLLQIAPC